VRSSGLIWRERFGSLTGQNFHRETRPWGGGLSDAKAVMMIMRVHVEKLLCQAAMGCALVLK
jgi:hypothetical protein